MILGALAYRSAKKRRLGEVRSTSERKVLEVSLLLLLALSVSSQSHLEDRMATDPLANVIIPLWAMIAYLVITFMPGRVPPSPTHT